MARHGQDREDLIREATALVPRGEFVVPGFPENVVIGFRGAAASVYFGADPALHFNAAGELRRGFVEGCLFKADAGRLIRMRRVRTPGEVQLQSRPLTDVEQLAMLEELLDLLKELASRLAGKDFELIGEAPEPGQIVPRAAAVLHQVTEAPLVVAATPRVAG